MTQSVATMRPNRRNRAILLVLLLKPLVATVHADVLNDHDNGPLTGLFGLPDSTEGAKLVGRAGLRIDTVVTTASHSIVDVGNNELLVLDGETSRLEMTLRYGLSDRFEVGVELPYVWHESGGLDTLIDSWHDAFRLPPGFRDLRPTNELEVRYTDAGYPGVTLTGNTRGAGDVRLIGGWRIAANDTRRLALRLGIKLPTGDSDALLGSGGSDLSIGLAGDYDTWLGRPSLNAYFRASAIRVGKPARLTHRYRKIIGHLAVGMGIMATDRIELRAQAVLRSAAYDSSIDNLGDAALSLTFGGSVLLTEQWRISLAAAEDLRVHTAPDVSFQLGLHYRP